MIARTSRIQTSAIATALLRARPIDVDTNPTARRVWIDAVDSISRLVVGDYMRLAFVCEALGLRVGHDSLDTPTPVGEVTAARMEVRESDRKGLLGRLRGITHMEVNMAVAEPGKAQEMRQLAQGDFAIVHDATRFDGLRFKVLEVKDENAEVKLDFTSLTDVQAEELRKYSDPMWVTLASLEYVQPTGEGSRIGEPI